MFSEIQKQLGTLASILQKEIPPINYYIQRGCKGAGVDNTEHAIDV
jgi:hypothetical protein